MNLRRIPRNVILLGVISLATDASTEMIYPLLPVFIAALGSGAVALGVIEGLAESAAALVKLGGGILSDKLQKRKAFVVIGYALSSLTRPLTGLVSSAWQIVAIRMVDRIGKGIRTAPRDALIASSVPKEDWGLAYGFHRGMDHAGAVVGPLLAIGTLLLLTTSGGVHDAVGALRWTFALAIIPGLAAITATFFIAEKTDPHQASRHFTLSLAGFDKDFKRYLAIIVLFTLGNSSDAFLLFRAAEVVHTSGWLHSVILGYPALEGVLRVFGDTDSQRRVVDMLFLPVLWSFFHVVKVLFSAPLGALSDRVGRVRVIRAGWSLYAIVYAGFALLDRLSEGGWQVAGMFVLFTAYAVYYAFTEGAERAFVADMVAPQFRGSAFGLFNFAVAIGSLPASVAFGFLYENLGASFAFGTGALIASGSVILLRILVRQR